MKSTWVREGLHARSHLNHSCRPQGGGSPAAAQAPFAVDHTVGTWLGAGLGAACRRWLILQMEFTEESCRLAPQGMIYHCVILGACSLCYNRHQAGVRSAVYSWVCHLSHPKWLQKHSRQARKADLCLNVAPEGNNSSEDRVAWTRVDNGALATNPCWSPAAMPHCP